MIGRRFFGSLICLALFSPLAGEKIFCQSAWDELVRRDPGVVDDASIDWQQRLILHSLTAAQARRYYRGANAEDLLVQDGLTLAEYLRAKSNPLGNVYVPLPGSCELFSVEGLLPDEIVNAQVRGVCGIPEEATAVILQVKTRSAGISPRVKLWASDLPEPAGAVVEGESSSFDELKAVTAVVSLCTGDRCRGEELRIRGRDTETVRAEAVGYFRPLNASDGAVSPGGVLFATEGSDNNFFGTGAGASNTTGASNSFFGGNAGSSNVAGSDNAFFGHEAGLSNTGGSGNSFYGAGAGSSNVGGVDNTFVGRDAGALNTGDWNNFLGADSGALNTTGSFNTFFGGQTGAENTEGSYNLFLGDLAGASNTTGSYNVFVGGLAGYSHSEGFTNTAVGDSAGYELTVEENNTFLGSLADFDPGDDPVSSPVTNATAIGANSYVSQSNSLVLGSINGVNGAAASTQVGIGTTAPDRLLHIAGDNAVFRMDRSSNSAAFMLVRTDSGGSVLKNFVIGVNASGANQGEFIINDLGTALGGGGQRRMTIDNAGDVTFTGDVITGAGALAFPDYVFATDYRLMPLGELREFVKTEKHLPEIPSAEKVEERGGINMTELQLKLLQKIEELTLYTIQQQETIDRLTSRLEALERTDSSDR